MASTNRSAPGDADTPSAKAGHPGRFRWRKQLWLGSLAAGFVMVIVGAVFWNNPLPYTALTRLPNELTAAQALRAEFPQGGAYMIPSPEADQQERTQLQEIGPPATLYIRYEGGPRWWVTNLLPAFGLNTLTAFILGLAMKRVSTGLGTSYRQRFPFLAWTGLAVALFPILCDPISWGRPLAWKVVVAAYTLIAWMVAASILTLFVETEDEPRSTGDATHVVADPAH